MKLFSINTESEHTHIHSPEEITMLMTESRKGGVIKEEEYLLLKNTLSLWEAPVRYVMIPRSKMLSAPDTIDTDQLFQLLTESPYSRIPIYSDNIDNIIGVIHLRDLLCQKHNDLIDSIDQIVHPVFFVFQNTKIKKVFSLLQDKQYQVAIIVDEFGGTSGMVTLEDLLEQIFGDLQDEFDLELSNIESLNGDRIAIKGETFISEINETLQLQLPDQNADTIAGLLLDRLGYIPRVQDEVTVASIAFRVEKMTGNRIDLVTLKATPGQIQRIDKEPRS